MFKRVQKHLFKNKLLATEVWGDLGQYFLARTERFMQQAQDCYQAEKLPFTLAEVKQLIEKYSTMFVEEAK